MAASAADIARVRRMVAEPTTTTYSDTIISDTILRYPVSDSFGEDPTELDGSVNDDWVPTYDLNGAAAEIWVEKVAALAANFDFSADGASFSRSQPVAQAQSMARYYQARMCATSTPLRIPAVREDTWIGNLPEPEV